MRFKSVRWDNGGSSGHTLGYSPPSVYPEDPLSCRLTCIRTLLNRRTSIPDNNGSHESTC